MPQRIDWSTYKPTTEEQDRYLNRPADEPPPTRGTTTRRPASSSFELPSWATGENALSAAKWTGRNVLPWLQMVPPVTPPTAALRGIGTAAALITGAEEAKQAYETKDPLMALFAALNIGGAGASIRRWGAHALSSKASAAARAKARSATAVMEARVAKEAEKKAAGKTTPPPTAPKPKGTPAKPPTKAEQQAALAAALARGRKPPPAAPAAARVPVAPKPKGPAPAAAAVTATRGARKVPAATDPVAVLEARLAAAVERDAANAVARRAEVDAAIARTPRAAAAKPAAELAADLRRASPNYGFGPRNFQTAFDSPLDQAAYIVRNAAKKSKRDGDYLRFVMQTTGLDEKGARAYGAQVAARLKLLAQSAPEGTKVLKIGAGNAGTVKPTVQPAVRTVTAVAKPKVKPKAGKALTPEERAAETIRQRLSTEAARPKGVQPPAPVDPAVAELAEAQRIANAIKASRIVQAAPAKPVRDFAAQTAKAREARAANRAARAAAPPPTPAAPAAGATPASLVQVPGLLVRAAFDDPVERMLYQHASQGSPAVSQFLQQQLKLDAKGVEKLAKETAARVELLARGKPTGSIIAVPAMTPAPFASPAVSASRAGSHPKRAIAPAGSAAKRLGLPQAPPVKPSVATTTTPRLVKDPAAAKAARLVKEQAEATAAGEAPTIGDSLKASLAAGPPSPSLASTPLGDAGQLPQLLAGYTNTVKAVAKLTKEGKGIPDTLRAQLVESTRILGETAAQVAPESQKAVNAAVRRGITALANADSTVPSSTANLGSTLNKTARVLDKAARQSRDLPAVGRAVDTTRALGKKLGGKAGPAADKLEQALRKQAGKSKSAKEKKALDDISRASTSLLSQVKKLPGDEAGSVPLGTAARMGATAAGGAGGFYAGQAARPEDDERSPLAWGMAGAAAGALSASVLSGLAMSPDRLAAIEKIVDWSRFSLLSAPKSMVNANMGALTAVFVKAAEKAAEGPKGVVAAARGMNELARQMATGVWFKAAFGDPQRYIQDPALRAAFAKAGGRSQLTKGKKGFLSWPARVIAAGDVVSSNAIMKMGYSRQAAQQANLGAEPVTQFGRHIMRALNEPVRYKVHPPPGVKGKIRDVIHKPYSNPKEHPGLTAALRFVSPFTRTAVNALEQGASYMPILGQTMRKPFGLTHAQSLVRQGMGAATIGAGAVQAHNTSPEIDTLVNSMAGPMTVPLYMGQRAMRMYDRDAPMQGILQTALEEIPMVAEQFGVQDILARPFVPGIMRDVARAIDPAFERSKGPSEIIERGRRRGGEVNVFKETAQTLAGGLQSRLPLFRELLPEEFAKHDVYGKSTFPERNKFLPGFVPDITLRGLDGRPEIIWPKPGKGLIPKILTSTPSVNPPDLPVNDPYTPELRALQHAVPEMGKVLSPPTVPTFRDIENLMHLGGRETMPLDRDLRAAVLRSKGAMTESFIKRTMNTPAYQEADDARRHFILSRMGDAAAASSAKSITPIMRGVTMSPAHRAQVLNALQAYIQSVEGTIPE